LDLNVRLVRESVLPVSNAPEHLDQFLSPERFCRSSVVPLRSSSERALAKPVMINAGRTGWQIRVPAITSTPFKSRIA
jgi:hypothetical protein